MFQGKKTAFYILSALSLVVGGIFLYRMQTTQIKPRIVIIGAGLSGMTAAYRLQSAGYSVQVIEARNRVGGRTHSATLNGKIIELGGEDICDGGDALFTKALVAELGLTLISAPQKYSPLFLIRPSGAIVNPDAGFPFQTLTEAHIVAQIETARVGATSLKDVINTFFREYPVTGEAFGIRLASFEGSSLEKLSPYCAGTLEIFLKRAIPGLKEVSPYMCIQDGNDQICRRIASQLLNPVLLNAPIKSIASSDNGKNIIITTASGKSFEADHVLLTIPAPLYNHIAIDESLLSRERREAIAGITCSMNAKCIVPIKPVQSLNALYSNGRFTTWHGHRNDIITLYYLAHVAPFTKDTVAEHTQHDISDIARVVSPVGSLIPSYADDAQLDETFTGVPVAYCWESDPYSQCSYSCIAAGQEPLHFDRIELFGIPLKQIFKPAGNRLFFAGEHESILTEHAGTIEAAIESGNRVAELMRRSIEA